MSDSDEAELNDAASWKKDFGCLWMSSNVDGISSCWGSILSGYPLLGTPSGAFGVIPSL
jgi:hypothetical protein